jgi:hypothetical protein
MEEHIEAHARLRRLWGVYNANGGVLGELAYVMGKLRGTAHCALCDITHRVRMKPEWKEFAASLDVPFELVHLNEQPEALVEVTAGAVPCVVAQTREGFGIILGPEELEAAGGSVPRFGAALAEALGNPKG